MPNIADARGSSGWTIESLGLLTRALSVGRQVEQSHHLNVIAMHRFLLESRAELAEGNPG